MMAISLTTAVSHFCRPSTEHSLPILVENASIRINCSEIVPSSGISLIQLLQN